MADLKNRPFKPLEVLLVDDEEGFVSVMRKRLEKRGINVTPALSGSDAVQVFKAHSFDLVLLDLKMEFMDGIEVLKIIKEMAPEQPVIMITGHGDSEDADTCLQLGAAECLPKPYELSDLLQKIKEVLKTGEKENGTVQCAPGR